MRWLWGLSIVAMAYMAFKNELTFGFFAMVVLLLMFIGRMLNVGPKVTTAPPPEPEIETIAEAKQRPKPTLATVSMRMEDVKTFRNLLMRHHEMKANDPTYASSSMANHTTAVLATLNAWLETKKKGATG